MSTNIEWTDETWNPIRAFRWRRWAGWHCERVSLGCLNCYAATQNMSRRFDLGTGLPYTRRSRDEVRIELDEETLNKPLHWRKPRRVFVCSMTDLFGEWVSDDMLDKVFAVMALTPHITYQILTKRPERMREYLTAMRVKSLAHEQWPTKDFIYWMAIDHIDRGRAQSLWTDNGFRWPLPNVWLGVSVEDQRRADERIPVLLHTPAAVRFLSCEPLLEAVDIRAWMGCEICSQPLPCDCGFHEEPGLDWVIVGGESGGDRRPCEPGWIENVAWQCETADVPVFVKQDSAPRPGQQGRIPDAVWALKQFPREVES